MLKIKGSWHYWFVVLDGATHIPIYTYLANTRSAPVCAWIGIHLHGFKNRDFLKTKMKRLLQTFKRRMDKLEKNADAWGITGWVRNTKAHLEQLLPAVGSRVLPTTTNAIERDCVDTGSTGPISHRLPPLKACKRRHRAY